ncbi:hypothetical protein [Oceanobacillus timonensis]|uniref:hypothetical protein n=1 Tax=Oceanobacillus timonensis TaxID=1926285 RepID=UPI0009BBAA8C|nr:hypothetical protein [Oceanobacillus timonensis]
MDLMQKHEKLMKFNSVKLNVVLDAMRTEDNDTAVQTSKEIAYSIYDIDRPFWKDAVPTLISAVILAQCEDIISTGKGKISFKSIAETYEDKFNYEDKKVYVDKLDDYFVSRQECSLSKQIYDFILNVKDEKKDRIFKEAIITIKSIKHY